MDTLIELAMQIIFCLLVAALLGAIIGYLLGRISRCGDNNDYERDKAKLSSYDNDTYDEDLYGHINNPEAEASSGMATAIANLPLNDNERAIGQEIGIRPKTILLPESEELDDLKEISGIGLKLEETLHELGIYNFDQIAQWTPENIDWVEDYLVFKGRINKEEWISQAKLLAAGGHTEFSKKVKKGQNKNY